MAMNMMTMEMRVMTMIMVNTTTVFVGVRIAALGLGLTSSSLWKVLRSLPVAEKTYRFKELYTESMIENPKKVGLSGFR